MRKHLAQVADTDTGLNYFLFFRTRAHRFARLIQSRRFIFLAAQKRRR
jgi:hypothetical protein